MTNEEMRLRDIIKRQDNTIRALRELKNGFKKCAVSAVTEYEQLSADFDTVMKRVVFLEQFIPMIQNYLNAGIMDTIGRPDIHEKLCGDYERIDEYCKKYEV